MEDLLPKSLISKLDNYLDQGEKIEDVISETFIPHIDFRWIILTDRRVILAVRKLVDYLFKDYHFATLDIDLNLGFIFDEMEFEIPGKNYRAQFYSSRRDKTLDFFNKIKANLEKHSGGSQAESQEIQDKNLQILKELAKLRDEGIITKREYQKGKRKIFKRL